MFVTRHVERIHATAVECGIPLGHLTHRRIKREYQVFAPGTIVYDVCSLDVCSLVVQRAQYCERLQRMPQCQVKVSVKEEAAIRFVN